MGYDTHEVGRRIKKLRRASALTQEDLSYELNISLDYLRKIESGRRSCSVYVYVLFAKYFDVSLDYLMLGKEYRGLPSEQELQRIIDGLTALKDSLKS